MAEKTFTGPLAGLKVIDLTQVLSGPFATMWLATMGAEVIKIENPRSPDVTRTYAPFANGVSAYFPTVNHNKKCITLNLKSSEGKELFKALIRDADVLAENYRPGVMDRLGLGYEVLKQINPRLVYASISGYGTYGPYKDRPGYDVIAQGMSGLMYLTGQADAPPTRVGSSIGDTVAGINAVVAILAALYSREQTGKGQMAETSLVDSLISLSTQDYIRYFVGGDVPRRMGNIYKSWAPYGTYQAADGYYNLGVGTDSHFRLFAQAIGQPQMVADPRFATHDDRVANRTVMDSMINAWAADKTVSQICDIMVEKGVPAAPVNSIVEVAKDPHIAGAREMFPTLHQEVLGAMQVTNIPVRFSESGLAPLKSVSPHGGDNEEIFTALGKTPEEIEALRQQGVI